MRFHLPALPGQPVTAENSSCAYTQKVRRFATMMHRRSHEVIVYGGGGFDGEASEYVDVYSTHGEDPIDFDPATWLPYNAAVIGAVGERLEAGDYLLLIAGRCQAMLADALPIPAVEFGIGYGGSFANYRVFESYAWMHTTYGSHGNGDPHGLDGNAYHAVIPNYFDPEEFPFGGNGDYLLFVGRLIERKGVEAAVEVARATGRTLYLAGEGDYRPGEDEDGIEYVGGVGPRERAELMAGASALLAPTTYIEPFGGVVVEAAMCGTPAITTDWGAFTETVVHGVTGWRCRRIGEMVWAAQNAGMLDRAAIRQRALDLYSSDVVAGLYENYFDHLLTLNGHGWYDAREARPGLAHSA